MARVRLWREEVADLPAVCMRCGADAAHTRTKTFSWHPPWVIALIVGGLLPYLLVALILTKKMRVTAPLCDAHKNHWLLRNLLIWGLFFALGAVGVGAFVLMTQAGPGQKNNDLGGYVCGGTVVGFLVWLVIAAVCQATSIRPVEITDDEITLTGVHKEFGEAVKDERVARPRKRRRRDDWDDEGDDYEPPPRRRRRDDDRDD